MVRIISQRKRRGGGFQSLNWLGRESQGKVRPKERKKTKIKLPYSDKFHQQQQRLISESKQKYCNSKEVVCPLQEKRKHYRPQSHYHTTHTQCHHSITPISINLSIFSTLQSSEHPKRDPKFKDKKSRKNCRSAVNSASCWTLSAQKWLRFFSCI